MMDDREIRAFWGTSLVEVADSALDQFDLPAGTKQFLRTIGLPLDNRLTRYLKWTFQPQTIEPFAFDGEDFVLIGIEEHSMEGIIPLRFEICLQERTGQCVRINRYVDDSHISFVNCTPLNLLRFLEVVLTFVPEARELGRGIFEMFKPGMPVSDQEKVIYRETRRRYERQIEKIREGFINIEPGALEQNHSYWSMQLDDWLM